MDSLHVRFRNAFYHSISFALPSENASTPIIHFSAFTMIRGIVYLKVLL
jgi:hypothetical protein